MAASNAISAHGTKLRRCNDPFPATTNYTTIAEVTSVSGPDFDRDFAEVTHMESEGWKEFLPMNRDMGEITLEVSFVPTDPTLDFSTGVARDWVDGIKRNYQLVFPDIGQTTWVVPVYIKSMRQTAGQNDPLKMTIVLRPSGVPSFA